MLDKLNDDAWFALFFGMLGGLVALSLFRVPQAAGIAAGIVVIGYDVWVRIKNQDLFTRDGGGAIGFIPLWLLGLALGAIALLQWLGWA